MPSNKDQSVNNHSKTKSSMSEVVWITNIYCVNGGASKHCTTGMANPLPIYEKIASW